VIFGALKCACKVASKCGFLDNQNVIIEKAIAAELEREGGAMILGSTSGSPDKPTSEIISLKLRDRTHSVTIA